MLCIASVFHLTLVSHLYSSHLDDAVGPEEHVGLHGEQKVAAIYIRTPSNSFQTLFEDVVKVPGPAQLSPHHLPTLGEEPSPPLLTSR